MLRSCWAHWLADREGTDTRAPSPPTAEHSRTTAAGAPAMFLAQVTRILVATQVQSAASSTHATGTPRLAMRRIIASFSEPRRRPERAALRPGGGAARRPREQPPLLNSGATSYTRIEG